MKPIHKKANKTSFKKGHIPSKAVRLKISSKAKTPSRIKISIANLPRHPKGYNSAEENPNWKGGKSWNYRKKHHTKPKPQKCEICGGGGKICLDHDHRTNEFRGWICFHCNVVIGFAKDSTNALEKIIEYLKRHEFKN